MSSCSTPKSCTVTPKKRNRRFVRKSKWRRQRRGSVEKNQEAEVNKDFTLTPVSTRPAKPAGNYDYASTLKIGLGYLEGNKDLSDVVLVVEGKEFDCHLLVLCTFSNYFRCLVQSRTRKCPKRIFKLDMIDAITMKMVLHFLYTGEVKVTKETARDLLFAAAYLQIGCLQRSLEQRHALFLGPENVLDYWQLTDLHQDYILLRKRCEKVAIRCFQTILETSKFVHLPLSQLSTLVFSDNLNVTDENIVFDAVMKWIHHDLPNRKCHARKLVDSIRLPLIDGTRYRKLKATFPDLFVEPLSDFVREAETFHGDIGAQMRYSSPRTELRPGGITEKGIVVVTGPTSSQGAGNGLSYVSELGEVESVDSDKHMKVWCFSLLTRRWYQLCNLLEYPGRHFASCTYGLYDLFLSGEHGMYRFSTRENTWVVCDPIPSQGRMAHGMKAINDSLYIFGGKTGDGFADYANTVEVYDASHETWETTPLCEISMPVSHFHSVAVQSKIYIFSGFTQGMSNERHVTNSIQCIDINTRTCTIVCHTAVLGPVVTLNTEIHQVTGRNLVKHWPGCRAFVNSGTLGRDCSQTQLLRVRSKILIIGVKQCSADRFSDVIMEFDFNKRSKKVKTWREKLPEVLEEMTSHVLLIPNMSLAM